MLRQIGFRAARSLATAPRSSANARLFHATTMNRVVHNVNTVEDFKKTISGESKVIVDCFAEWCGPCKQIAPILAKLSEEESLKDKVHFVKFDVDELPQLSGELGVRAMPTFLFFDGGNKVDELIGADPMKLVQKLQELATK